ncbi:IclR family transcriptional regulator [Photobacterium indicum]|jgi:DNA-binding IclR family transcriptional regulator|uniref:HTH-type transcriptional repressor AllR n=1 Tax=Photobacterium indicum TaxID=81447 RepID=A0A2T3LE89_9GAMM|nr:IclR family transcriptional regulator [Photobacterium indicum]PSV49697.1 IclR family transcriptional regulator [Photobacterium indicum]
MSEKTTSSRYLLSPNQRLLQILLTISSSPAPLSAQMISEQTDTPVSSVYRYIATLREWNFIEEQPSGKRYTVGPAALQLMRNFHTFSPLSEGVRPVLKRLQDQTGEMSAYMVPVGFNALCVEMVDSPYALRCSYQQGQSQPLILGASSKVILAQFNEKRLLSTLTHFGIADEHEKAKWFNELRCIKKEGYALSTSEFDLGVSSVSAPVFLNKKVVGAISVMAPTERINNKKNSIVFAVLQAARMLPPEW